MVSLPTFLFRVPLPVPLPARRGVHRDDITVKAVTEAVDDMAVADRLIVVAGTLLGRCMALVQLPDLTVQMLTVLMVAVQPPEAVLAGGRQVEAVTARMTAV